MNSTPELTGTFYHPCLTCGGTVNVIGGARQPHGCKTIVKRADLIAYAWWAGHDAATQADTRKGERA